MLRDQHRYLEAATHLEQAIVLAPERAKYHFYLGEMRRATGDFAGALTAFKRTIELAPDHLEARYYHSDLLVRNQQLSQARAGFADLLARDPDHVQGGLGLGGLLIRLGESTAAISVLKRAATADPHNPAPHYLLAQAYTESDRPDDARRAQGRFQQLSAAERHLNQGNIYIRQGAWNKAIDSLRRALASDSTSVEICLRLATVYAQQKRFADARAALEQVLARNPGHRDAYIMLGDLYLHEGMSKEADAHFVRALAIDPDSFAAIYGLGRARFKKRRFCRGRCRAAPSPRPQSRPPRRPLRPRADLRPPSQLPRCPHPFRPQHCPRPRPRGIALRAGADPHAARTAGTSAASSAKGARPRPGSPTRPG